MKYLDSLSEETKQYYKILSKEFPEFLKEYIETPAMLRLDGISMFPGCDHTKILKIKNFNSRLKHSIGVALIIWNFTKDKKQTLAGLFHDIATPVFKHCIDFMNKDYEKQESTEELTTKFIKDSEEIMALLNKDGILPKTILYSLDGGDNAFLDTLIGAFQGTDIAGKIQHGSAWWFNDNKVGMIDQMTSLANLGLLGNFIGMLTDSRSFLSYTRHEYFRRILCNLIGTWVENGEYPNDIEFLGKMVQDISYYNTKNYFGF